MKPFIFVFTLIGFGFLYFSTPAEAQGAVAASCEKNADGHYVVPNQVSNVDCYTYSSAIEVAFKAVYLCKGSPDILAGYTNCEDLNLTPFTKQVTKGFEYSSPFTMPLPGTYDYVVIVNGVDYKISGVVTFDRSITGGSNAEKNRYSQGRFCQPPSANVSFYDINQAGFTLLSECSPSFPETLNTMTFKRDKLKANGEFTNAPTHNQINPGDAIYLMDSSGNLAASNVDVEDIVYVLKLPVAKVISEATSRADMAIAMRYTMGVNFGYQSGPTGYNAIIFPGLVTPEFNFN